MIGQPMCYEVLFINGAERDLESIPDGIGEIDCVVNVDSVLDQSMEKVVEASAQFPERGSYPRALLELGIKEYRQTSFKPYRVILPIAGSQVIIVRIVDGRRDMQSVLACRLLGA